MNNNIRPVLNACKNSIEEIRKAINTQKCTYCNETICKEIESFCTSLNQLWDEIKQSNPLEAAELRLRINNIIGKSRINPYDFGAIMAIINILNNSYSLSPEAKKIFISHSSKDKIIIESFVNKILRLGCQLELNDIICTSIESTGIKTGEDIRNYLKKHLKQCDYVFFMISDNYKESGICLNEMGAAWILDKKVKPFLFPNLDFNNLGWLYEISKGSALDNEGTLDQLHDELLEEYTPTNKLQTADWTVQKKEFLSVLNENCPNQPNITMLCPITYPINGNKNILNPAINFFSTDVDNDKYCVYMSKNSYDITIEFNTTNDNWGISLINKEGWIVSNLEKHSKTFKLGKGKEGYMSFIFNNTGEAEIIIKAENFIDKKHISWK